MLAQIENQANMLYFPIWVCYLSFPQQIEQLPQTQEKNNSQFDREMKINQRFIEQIEKRHQKSTAKQWSQQQDDLLLKLGQNNSISKRTEYRFHGKNYEVCLRRYQKLIRNQQRWPQQDDRTIKNLRDGQGMSWTQIHHQMKKYSVKEIRERYRNFLQIDLKRERWTIQEDLVLWNSVCRLGKKWKNICKELTGRTQLQLRNRYYKFLLPIAEKIKEQFTGQVLMKS